MANTCSTEVPELPGPFPGPFYVDIHNSDTCETKIDFDEINALAAGYQPSKIEKIEEYHTFSDTINIICQVIFDDLKLARKFRDVIKNAKYVEKVECYSYYRHGNDYFNVHILRY